MTVPRPVAPSPPAPHGSTSVGRSLLRKKRVLSSAFVGTTIEWYDFYLYGTAAALVFNKQFFPSDSELGSLLASFATFAIAFFVRPLGGIVAGHLGDRIGRKALLVASLLTMGVASTLIGALPTFATAGWFAVAALVTLRLLQGLSAGAEWGGSALLSVEHAPASRRGLFGSFTQIGSAAGMLLATGAFALVQLLLTDEQFQAFGWRLPFLASALLVAIGLLIRLGVDDAEEFRELRARDEVATSPVRQVLREGRRGVLVTIGLRTVQPALYSVLTVYTLTYLADRRGDSSAGLIAILVASAVGLASGPFWGWLSDRWGRRRLAVVSAAATAVLIWPYFLFLDLGPLVLLPLVYLVVMNWLHDSIYGPQAAWFAEQFPVHLRYSGVSLGYQVGTIVSGGMTPFIAAALLALGGGSPWLICAYVGVLAALSVVAALAAADPVTDPASAPGPEPVSATGSGPAPDAPAAGTPAGRTAPGAAGGPGRPEEAADALV
ncbi:MFS transporter [Kocuria flava]|uniref:MFS transporter n=1 Tax=Kocuria flava TaxID=446860 RepID=A0A0U2NW92_9MICC|nr:MFS transporter [Kocuria flava]ALU38477.1 MFS transporter [Kocuria flava]GEO93008.1 MFS transporter [Kocuria flava]